jgi:hypothetical protein
MFKKNIAERAIPTIKSMVRENEFESAADREFLKYWLSTYSPAISIPKLYSK